MLAFGVPFISQVSISWLDLWVVRVLGTLKKLNQASLNKNPNFLCKTDRTSLCWFLEFSFVSQVSILWLDLLVVCVLGT